jgi:hypothetical protein
MDAIEHWVCDNCDSVDGPTVGPTVDGGLCRICRDEGEHGVIVELVPRRQLRGAVEALRDIQDVAFEGNGAAADTQRLAAVLKLVNEAVYRLGGAGRAAHSL